ncbi:hypothetical protein ACHWQZ_G019119 [Mnemiopsis leidyi]
MVLPLLIILKAGSGKLEDSSGDGTQQWPEISRNLISHYHSTATILATPVLNLNFQSHSGSIKCAAIAVNLRHTRFNNLKGKFEILLKRPSFYEAVSLRVKDGKTEICPMDINFFELYDYWAEYPEIENLAFADDNTFQCEVAVVEKCNKYSVCSTDECNCNDGEVMYCPTRSGEVACIAYSNICDGIMDCMDGSDECFCPDIYDLTCHKFPQLKRLCINEIFYCTYQWLIESLACEGLPSDVNCTYITQGDGLAAYKSPFVLCLENKFQTLAYTPKQSGESLCQTSCSSKAELAQWSGFCKHITFTTTNSLKINFNCNTIDEHRGFQMYHLSVICDGKEDCSNSADELNCPGRFYCSTNEYVTWINKSRVCDKRKDCSNGKDECAGCEMDGLASNELLVRSRIIGAITVLVGIGIIIINIFVGYQTFQQSHDTKAAQIDRILRLQICFYDLLMGLYLLLLVIAAIALRFKGEYCKYDEEWRASLQCMVLGIIFSTSSHGSLLIIAVMSIIRCIKCIRGNTVEFSTRKIVAITAVVSLFNTLHAILPILPVYQLQNFFRTSIYLVAVEKNPFMQHRVGTSMMEQAHKLHRFYYNNSSTSDIALILNDLKHVNLTSDDTIFDVSDIGYYGNTPLCVSNIFKTQESYKPYKMAYCIILSMLLIAVSLAYVTIVCRARWSERDAGPQNNNNTSKLTLKVSLMIITQLASWVSFIVAVVIFEFTGNDPSVKIFEIFALIVIPINSLLNPVFYSGLYNAMLSGMWNVWRKIVGKVNVQNI